MIVTVEGQQFNTLALARFDEQMFVESFRGKVKCDINEAWKQVKKHIEPPLEVKLKPKKKRKRNSSL